MSGAAANPSSNEATPNTYVTAAEVEAQTSHVNSVEALEGILSDWSLPGEHAAASFDVARAVCRRAERAVVRLTPERDIFY